LAASADEAELTQQAGAAAAESEYGDELQFLMNQVGVAERPPTFMPYIY
jgi:hypothetical protein